jgi:IS30 family transposase
VSHETIYRSLFIQARGVLKKELLGHLRSKRRIRRSQHSRIFRDSRGQIADAISIRERPAEVEDRAIPGHWEGDLLTGFGSISLGFALLANSLCSRSGKAYDLANQRSNRKSNRRRIP